MSTREELGDYGKAEVMKYFDGKISRAELIKRLEFYKRKWE